MSGETPVSWRVFAENPLFSMLRLISSYQLSHDGHISGLDDFFHLAKSGDLPSVSWLEPNYGILNNNHENDHPPTNIGHAQNLVARIYNSLLNGGNSLWGRTLFILTYDEHGGLYDHVPPQPAKDDLGARMPSTGSVFQHS